ncbi:hypothetical protein GTO89_06125 [Heliobacterium gestii]|uniref:Metallopeptidase family protein n=1 Tax=Heliomicrobium gestii TaxID=2699 RepID=A0A845LBD4_HELGE|nr:metallopeptidase family protein [Heliomicrobium gestii]MBM7866059.1 hypothetical protein [Heliomicrobium gestii]MZP42614.1 hypothetical protein [Heliomicrobium gestii]
MSIPFDIDRFADLAERMIAEIPEKFLLRLNGGIHIQPDTIQDDEGFFILGECFFDEFLGHWINIYHGSFAGCFAEEPAEVWEDELYETILHELRHHLEDLAGADDLLREEMAELEAWRAERENEKTAAP